MSKTWASQIETWNQAVRAGQGASITRELAKIPRGKIPIELLAKVANICWRISQPSIGLRLLFPELRRQAHRHQDVPPDALVEYAGCLLEVGALGEAKTILKGAYGKTPRANFYLALLLFKEWDYAGALPLLEAYLAQIPGDYHALVVRVNLAAAYVMNRDFAKATATLKSLREELQRQGHKLLLGNTHEIESQIFFERGDHEGALACLAKSEALLSETRNMGWLYCKKWQFLNKLAQNATASRAKSRLVAELKELRERARGMASWETLRDLDLHWALHEKDAALLERVYFGTPAQEYRNRVLRLSEARGLTIGESARFHVKGESGGDVLYDLRPQEFIRDGDGTFLIKKLLLILASDFYAPFRVGQLFSHLFEGEYFDVDSSPDRVFQLIRRLRVWMKEEQWRATVEGEARGYRLVFQSGSGFQMDRRLPAEILRDKSTAHLAVLKREFGDRVFTASELCDALRVSRRSANRMLRELKEGERVECLGSGPSTRFKIAS